MIPFVVRNDASHSDILFQTSDETWQAYNTYGGNSLVPVHQAVNCPAGKPDRYKGAVKVSYNRPWHTPLDDQGRDWSTDYEYPMIRFLEANGYDVSYISGVDIGQQGAASAARDHKVFVSAGHDEYWSGEQRANVEAARDAGVNLGVLQRQRGVLEDPLGAEHRRLEHRRTGRWSPTRRRITTRRSIRRTRRPGRARGWIRGSARRATAGKPQNALTGQFFVVNSGTTDITGAVAVQQAPVLAEHRGRHARVRPDRYARRGSRHPRLRVGRRRRQRLPARRADRPVVDDQLERAQSFLDYGSTTRLNSTATHHLTLYRAAERRAGVRRRHRAVGVGAGQRDRRPATTPIRHMQQATVNLFADMGAQPTTLMPGA